MYSIDQLAANYDPAALLNLLNGLNAGGGNSNGVMGDPNLTLASASTPAMQPQMPTFASVINPSTPSTPSSSGSGSPAFTSAFDTMAANEASGDLGGGEAAASGMNPAMMMNLLKMMQTTPEMKFAPASVTPAGQQANLSMPVINVPTLGSLLRMG